MVPVTLLACQSNSAIAALLEMLLPLQGSSNDWLVKKLVTTMRPVAYRVPEKTSSRQFVHKGNTPLASVRLHPLDR
jgi:hypothetical protein